MSKSSQQSGRMEHLLIVDNIAEKVVLLDLEYKGGDVLVKIKDTGNFPVGLKDIKVSVHTGNETLLVSDDQLTVLNSSFELISQMKLHSPIADACIDGKELLFVQSNKVWSESLDNLKQSIINLKCIAGSGKTVDKDGSGLSSSFALTASISKYQNSILVGSGNGKVRIISKVRAIGDFLENTFGVGVVGFGLHKKKGSCNENHDLDSCRNAHKEMSDYFDKLTIIKFQQS